MGLRYLLTDQESYHMGADRVKSHKDDTFTGVLGLRYAKSFVVGESVRFMPHVHAALTYDFVRDKKATNVRIMGLSNYQMLGYQ